MICSNAFTLSVMSIYAEADQDATLDFSHHASVYLPEVSNHSLLIDCPDLFKLNHRQNMVMTDPADVYVRRLTGILFDPGCDRCDDQGGTVPVADIVLKNDDRSFASLL